MPLSNQMPSPPSKRAAFATCSRVGAGDRGSGRGPAPTSPAPPGEPTSTSSRPLERSGKSVGREAVEAAVALVLGHVDALADRVDGGGLVVEEAHRRPVDARAGGRAGRTPRPGRRRTPRRRATCPTASARPRSWRSCRPGSGRRRDLAVGGEADRRRPGAARGERLGVRHEDPAAVVERVGRLPVREDVPRVGRARDGLSGARDLARLEARGQADAVGVWRPKRAVRPGPDAADSAASAARQNAGPNASAPAASAPVAMKLRRLTPDTARMEPPRARRCVTGVLRRG